MICFYVCKDNIIYHVSYSFLEILYSLGVFTQAQLNLYNDRCI